ncbi:hypothetical protein [Parafrankia sp. EUN1f]|uniref:hypothetical protein n=1 Tax=Parafrankia sp. EUN1f TaxID=102897 RepID=UPI0001C44663|nr:hypothetical protein [Parafrankia sp. EUN1f]EFC85394.1 hypothetical protein FrEUN1fDRAFT_1541 [Parafrankia sp. EUN1f]
MGLPAGGGSGDGGAGAKAELLELVLRPDDLVARRAWYVGFGSLATSMVISSTTPPR